MGLLGRVWKDPVGSKVISAAVLVASSWLWGATTSTGAKWFRAMGTYLLEAVLVPRWTIFLCGLIATCLSAFVIFIVAYLRSQLASYVEALRVSKIAKPAIDIADIQLAPPVTSPVQTPKYLTDVLFGFRWRWGLLKDGAVTNVKMYCPECDLELVSKNIERTRAYGVFLCRCENCRYSHNIDHETVSGMLPKVIREAERRLRNGEWQKQSAPRRS